MNRNQNQALSQAWPPPGVEPSHTKQKDITFHILSNLMYMYLNVKHAKQFILFKCRQVYCNGVLNSLMKAQRDSTRLYSMAGLRSFHWSLFSHPVQLCVCVYTASRYFISRVVWVVEKLWEYLDKQSCAMLLSWYIWHKLLWIITLTNSSWQIILVSQKQPSEVG